MTNKFEDIASVIDNAALKGEAIPQLSETAAFTLSEAYNIQEKSVRLRLERGERRVGIKVGFTSRAKMIQMGIDDMIWGRLTDGMLVEDGGEISFSEYVHPRVEPEVAYLLKDPLEGPVTTIQAMAAVEAIAPAIEIIDSRYKEFKFTVEDVVADNASSSGFVVGPWNCIEFDHSNLGMILEFDGRPTQIGSTAAILGNPARSLANASRMVAEYGERLEAGWIIMAGGATVAEELRPGTSVRNSVEHLGSVGFKVSS
ncbi:MAG: fumarylacetoacetate hydrolase family protein [Pseudomonadota bacterium]|nr:fumarylacetoacetate hydrolase family protein [Pseudomonadota bacterium]